MFLHVYNTYFFWIILFFIKQLDMFVYRIRKFDCQQIVTLLSWWLLDLAATFQAILRCEMCLYFDVLFSRSSVIIQCVSKENGPVFAQITSSAHNPPMHFSLISLSQVEGDGDEEVLSCVGGRSFRSVRERWWYIALSKCGVSTDVWPHWI